jgi:hypothetical protein
MVAFHSLSSNFLRIRYWNYTLKRGFGAKDCYIPEGIIKKVIDELF